MKRIVNLATGAVTVRELTTEESNARAEDAVKWALEQNTRANQASLKASREDALESVLESYRGDQSAPKAVKDYLAAKG